jgi:type VI secretion system protein VasD
MITRRALLGIIAVLATRCSSPPPPAVLTLTAIGSADQNPNPKGEPSPVEVRLFQLKSPAKFERSDYAALIDNERNTLGSEGKSAEAFVLHLGETRTVTLDLDKGVRFIGAAVLFSKIDETPKWRAVSPVAESGPSKLTLKINGLTATIT